MNIEQVEQQVIINEWQLGQQLNTAVHHNTREKFNLLLSFLSDDACDFAQFTVKDPEPEEEQTDLRKTFNLSAAQPLVNEGPSTALLEEFNRDLHQGNLHDIRFKQLLCNEAVLCKSNANDFPVDVLENLSLRKQQRMESSLSIATEAHVFEVEATVANGVSATLLDEYQQLGLINQPAGLDNVNN